jgi:hypothetical protein
VGGSPRLCIPDPGQAHLFEGGWFVVGTLGHRTGGAPDDGFDVSLEAGRQLDERWQVALRPAFAFTDSGDPSVQLRSAWFS